MSAGDLVFKNNILYTEDSKGNIIPIAISLPEFSPVMESLTVYRDVCKDIDIDALREMQKHGDTFNTIFHKVVQTEVQRCLQNILGPLGYKIMPRDKFLEEVLQNVKKH